MSVQTQIDRIKGNVTDAFNAVSNKGGTVPASKISGNLKSAIDSIPTGVTLPTLDNPGTADDLCWGKELIDGDGNKVTGTFELIPVDFAETLFVPAPTVMERDVNGTKKIYLRSILAGRLGWEAKVPMQMEANADNFGDAKPEDVIEGVTFTSAEGLGVSGMTPMLPAGQQAALGIASEAYRVDYAAYPVVRSKIEIPTRIALDGGSFFQADTPFKRLPNAEPNLKAENIKKGVSIFDIIGTYEGSGGGSGVISAVATGTYTPASDISSGVEIEHGLGVTPNFCIWMAENDFSDITDVSAAVVGAMVAKPMIHSVSSGMTYPYQYFLRGYNVSGLSNGTASYKSEGCMTDTIVTILGNSTYKLKSGLTYRWVAGVINA